MKYQKVSVDYFEMAKTMLVYVVLAVMCYLMIRLFKLAIVFPRTFRDQHQDYEKMAEDLKKRFPKMDITADELREAENEVQQMLDEAEEEDKRKKEEASEAKEQVLTEETKKDL